MLQTWLESYDPKELFDTSKTDGEELDRSSLPAEVVNGKALRIVPRKEDRRMGFNKVRVRARAPGGHRIERLDPCECLSSPSHI